VVRRKYFTVAIHRTEEVLDAFQRRPAVVNTYRDSNRGAASDRMKPGHYVRGARTFGKRD
jgi:hypothetical protein